MIPKEKAEQLIKKYLVNKQYFSSYPEIAKYYNINYCTLKNQLYKHNSIENAILYIKQNLENEKNDNFFLDYEDAYKKLNK